jgi:hypothetical protein
MNATPSRPYRPTPPIDVEKRLEPIDITLLSFKDYHALDTGPILRASHPTQRPTIVLSSTYTHLLNAIQLKEPPWVIGIPMNVHANKHILRTDRQEI